MAILFSNNALTTLAANINDSVTTLAVAATTGANFPVANGTSGDYFVITMEDSLGHREFIKVPKRATDTFGSGPFPCTRGYWGSTARAWTAGDSVDIRWSADAIEEYLSNLSGRYLGAFAAAPTVDAFGSAVLSGDIYYDTALLSIYQYTGAAWVYGFSAFAGGNLTGAHNENKTTVASATTPDIWTDTGGLIDYTGTATSTGFAAAPQAGAARVLNCTGAALFTAGANMLIQGVASGATFTAEAGDVITVRAITTTQFRLTISKTSGGAIVGKIKFPATQNSSSDANTLDDYEEGQYIPVDNSSAGLTLSIVIDYVKIGRLVFCSLSGSYPATADANYAQFSLPFACAKNGSGVLYHGGASTGARLFANASNPTNCVVYESAPGGQVTNAGLSFSTLVGSLTYQTVT